MYRVFIIIISLVLWVNGNSQVVVTLQQCIDSALANNIPVKQKYLLSQSAAIDWHQSRSNLLPAIGGTIYHGISQGKSIDPSTNNFVNQSLNYANYQFSGAVTVFNGGSLHNNVKQYATAYEAAKMEWQQAKDNLVLDVILAYLQVLNNEDLLTSSMKQADVSRKQLDRYQVLDSQGAIKPSDLTDLKGQLMNDELAIITNRNAFENAKLSLNQLMNKPYNKNIQVQRIDVEQFLSAYKNSSEDVYQNALQQFSLVKSVELRRKSYEYAVRSAKGQLYPNIFFDGGLTTRYSSIPQNSTVKVPYNSQLSDNLATFAEVGITIPIFNRSIYRNRIKQANIIYKNSELIEQNTKLLLHQQIDQAYLNMINAFDRFKISIEQVSAYESSFKAAEIRFNAGVGTSIDYLTSKDRLDRANISLISSKYDFVLRKKILDYYNSNIYNQ
jgi:outer membrane protein